jgi:hypothetical protein
MHVFWRLTTLAIVVMICGTAMTGMFVWTNGRFPFVAPPPIAVPQTPDEVKQNEDLDYLTAIIAHSFGENSDEHAKLLAGLAAKHTGSGLAKTYRAVFDGALEMVPPGHAAGTYVRLLSVVKALRAGAQWESAKQTAKLILGDLQDKLTESLPPSERCVTTFTRAQGSDPATVADRAAMNKAPKIYTSADGSFFLCLPIPKRE